MEEANSESAPSESTASPQSGTQQEHAAPDNTGSRESETQDADKPAGFDRVEFTPEQKARVDRIYGNMKRYENDSKEQRELNQRLVQELTAIQQSQQQIVSHIQVNDFQEAEARLNSERDTAWSKGDYKAFTAANDKIHEIKTQRLLAQSHAQQQKQQPVPPQKPQGMGAERIVDRAMDQGEINPVDANIARSWMAETDTGGNLKRPWTQPTDPRNHAAAREGQAVFNSPAWADKPFAEKLREIDRRMGMQVQQQNQGQNVLGAGNLTSPRQNNTIKLAPEIEKLAIRTKFGGPKAKTDQDHIEAWKKAVAKSQSKGAKR